MVDEAIAALASDLDADADGIAIVAVGGYGRGRLAPGSDVDLLFTHGDASDDAVEALVSAVLYPLWDAGLTVGHSVRTLAESGRGAGERLEDLTTLLTARVLWGDATLADAVRAAAVETLRRDPSSFVEGLREWRLEREGRYGRLGEQLEPDLKESIGGLRDVHLVEWLSVAFAPCGEPDAEWVEDGALWLDLAREALHRTTNSPSNHLVADAHDPLATLLGVAGEPGWDARDVLLRELLVRARRVALAASGAMEAAVGASRPRAARASAGRATAAVGGIPAPAVAPNGAWTEETLGELVDMLATGEDAVDALEALDARGDLGALLPEWDGVRGRPQRDPYHRYPVDVHLVRTAAEMARSLARPADPFAGRAAGLAGDVRVPLLGALLHDIGKVGRGSHAEIGTALAASVVRRVPIPSDAADDVLFLVREHLLLSDTATRRDLQDEDLIVRIAARVGDPQRLALLYLLTMADGVATGPAAVSPWRVALVRELVAKVDGVFERGGMDAGRADAVRRAERALRGVLAGEPADRVERFLADVPPAYAASSAAEDARMHLSMVVPPPRRGEVRFRRRAGRLPGTHIVSVAAADRAGLLADLAGAFALARLPILTAHAFTTESGVALDVFDVRVPPGEDDAPTWDGVGRALELAGDRSAGIADRLARRRSEHRTRAGAPVEIRVDDAASALSTVVEVSAPDRLGLLSDLTRALTEQGLDVHSARVATYGERVVDVFYVTTGNGEPLTDHAAVERLRTALAEAAAPTG